MGNDRPPPIDRQLLAGLNELDRSGPRRIGDDYAAATVVGDELIIWVTSEVAGVRASKLAGQLTCSVRVETVGDRYRHTTMKDIFDALAACGPSGVGYWGVGLEEPVIPHPPRVALTIQEPGEASPAVELWAREAVDRYGSDRVVIKRGPGSTEDESH